MESLKSSGTQIIFLLCHQVNKQNKTSRLDIKNPPKNQEGSETLNTLHRITVQGTNIVSFLTSLDLPPHRLLNVLTCGVWTEYVYVFNHLCRKSGSDVGHGGGTGRQGEVSQITVLQQQSLRLRH